jgi:hypothetical protein
MGEGSASSLLSGIRCQTLPSPECRASNHKNAVIRAAKKLSSTYAIALPNDPRRAFAFVKRAKRQEIPVCFERAEKVESLAFRGHSERAKRRGISLCFDQTAKVNTPKTGSKDQSRSRPAHHRIKLKQSENPQLTVRSP